MHVYERVASLLKKVGEHVNVDFLQLMPTCQGGATRLHRQ